MPDTLSRPLRVFLCHAHSDAAPVRELYLRLIKAGVDAWLDKDKLLPGQDWEHEIRKAVREVDVVIVCLSKQFNQAGFRQKEVRLALDTAMEQPEGDIFIIPARLEVCDTLNSLRKWHWVDLFEEAGYEMLMRALKQRHQQRLQFEAEERGSAESVTVPVSTAEKRTGLKTTPGGQIIYTFGDIEFVKVPAGKFLMGSNDEVRQADDEEKPQHIVDLPYNYYMARFPVTNEQYDAYVQAKKIKHPVSGWEYSGKRDHPIVNISWKEAMAYCRWLSELLNSELPSGLVLRLPTEAEWEKAAYWTPSPIGRGQTGGESLIYPWGHAFDKNKCNTYEGGKRETTSVSTYSPHGDSPCGCADMSGNVWEWTHSVFKPYPYKAKDGRESENASDLRVLRGGSFYGDGRVARCASRLGKPIQITFIFGGVRVVVAPPVS